MPQEIELSTVLRKTNDCLRRERRNLGSSPTFISGVVSVRPASWLYETVMVSQLTRASMLTGGAALN